MSIVHWADRPGDDLAVAVGAPWACLRHLTIGPGEPLHLDGEDRETVVWTLDRDAVVVRRPGDVERSVRAEGPLQLLVCAVPASPVDAVEPGPTRAVVRPTEVAGERLVDGKTSITRRDVGAAAGAVRLGLELVDVAPLRRSLPALDVDEVAVVLDGDGDALVPDGERAVERGSVVGASEHFVAGPKGLRLLVFRERLRVS